MNKINKWILLKDDIERGVEEGYELGFNMTPDTADGGKFIAYRYMFDKMNEIEGRCDKQSE